MPPYRTSRRLLAVLLASGLLAACGEQKPAQNAGPPPAPVVTVAKPTKKLVADTDEYVGRFVAYDFVEVRARVSGYLDKIAFTDGQMIAKGQALFTIDRRPYLAALDQAKAARSTAEANLAYADSELKRAEGLVRGTTITQQQYEQRIQAKRVAEAALVSNAAAIRQAELDLEYTELAAPIDGRIGDRRVSIGNLVTGGTGTGTTLLATIASIDPIRFEFTMDEGSYLRYVRAAPRAAADDANRGMSLPVKLKLLDEKEFAHEGRIDFVDNAIERSSGTIRARAQFTNPSRSFTPGMFGRIQIPAGAPAEALLVPDTAIGTEQVRKFVYVVGPDNTATPKYVTIGQSIGGLRVVSTGLDANDTVIVNGLMRVRPGAKVTPQEAPSSANGQSQAARTN